MTFTNGARRLVAGIGGEARVWALTAVLAACALGAHVTVVRDTPALTTRVPIPWPLLAALVAAAALAAALVHTRRQSQWWTMEEVPFVPGLAFMRPDDLVLAQFVGLGVALLGVRRISVMKAGFNLARAWLEVIGVR